ncbi:MAG: Zn-dependent exopeptidase M28 [Planctomycetes bacterium]|nr:Zn-dependent exopeptidase M28 [Planctomycetota bacterium]
MPSRPHADERQLRRHVALLCDDIGCRYSGTPAEQRAADYIEGRFLALRLANVHQHRFEFPNWNYTHSELSIRVGGKTRRIAAAMPMCFSPGTGPRGVRGPIAYLQTGAEFDFRRDLRGKIGLVIGSLGLGDPKMMKRVRSAGMAALLTVDSRVPYAWRTTLGAAPQWMEGYDVPTIGVPFLEAERIVRELPARAHAAVEARTFPATSQNVVAEITGSRRPDEVILVSGHHDSVLGIVGADDNGSGVAFTLELARLFARRRPARTIRFVSYGVEEKLSVGSYLYMRSLPPRERARIVLALNADGISSCIGTDMAIVTGSAALERLVRQTWLKRRHPCEVRRAVNPYSDHFPPNIHGIPSILLTRPTIMTEGYWTLHSVHDNPDHVSPAVLARTIDTAAVLLDRVANAARLPFPRAIAPGVMRGVRATARQAYRHPWNPETYRYPTE